MLDTAFARNPQLKAMEAEVRQAQASLDLARKSNLPDVTIGSSVDVKADTLVVLAAGDGHAADLARQGRRRNRRGAGRANARRRRGSPPGRST